MWHYLVDSATRRNYGESRQPQQTPTQAKEACEGHPAYSVIVPVLVPARFYKRLNPYHQSVEANSHSGLSNRQRAVSNRSRVSHDKGQGGLPLGQLTDQF